MSDSGAGTGAAAGGGIGLFGAVFLVFLVLKLTGTDPVAGWSWWWVTAPLWGLPALLLSIGLVLVMIAGAIYVVAKLRGTA